MPMRRRLLLTQDEPNGPCRRGDRREKQVNAQGLSRPGVLNQHKISRKCGRIAHVGERDLSFAHTFSWNSDTFDTRFQAWLIEPSQSAPLSPPEPT